MSLIERSHCIPYAYKFSLDFIFVNFANQRAIAKIKTQNVYAYSTSLLLQATIRKIKIAKIVRCGTFAEYTSHKNLYAYGIICRHGNNHIENYSHAYVIMSSYVYPPVRLCHG